MQLISDEYRKLNKQLHEEVKEYGRNGADYLDYVVSLVKQLKTQDILDYGCGKSELQNNLPFKIQQYDPAIEKYAELPKPAKIVICTDVIEHIEPEFLDNVLKHIKEVTLQYCYMVVATEQACKTLPDGRNAHLIVKDYRWWINKLFENFDILNFQHYKNRVGFVLQPNDLPNKDLK